MFLGYEQKTISNTVVNRTSFTIPSGCAGVSLQADTQHIRYTMTDESYAGPTQTRGMLLLTTEAPKDFSIEDFLQAKFHRGAGSDGILNVHYYGGRRGL